MYIKQDHRFPSCYGAEAISLISVEVHDTRSLALGIRDMFSTLRNPRLTKIYVVPLFFTTSAMMTWAISVLYALDLGADVLQVNLITTVWSAMGILVLVPFGLLSDRFGRRPMLLYPRVLALIGVLIRAFATNPDHLLLAAFVGGFAGAGFFPILLSMITDLTSTTKQKEAISTLFLFSGVGQLIGPLAGSFLLTLPFVSLRTLHQIDLVAQAGILIYIAIYIKETKMRSVSTQADQPSYQENIAALMRTPRFIGLLIMVCCYFFAFAIMSTYIPILGRVDLLLSDAEVSSLSTFRSAGVMLIRFSSTTFLLGVSMKLFLLTMLALGGITSLMMPFAGDYISIGFLAFVYGISFGATMSLGSAFVAADSTPQNRGIANSIYNAAQATGNIFKVFTSSMAETMGLTPVFIMSGITAFVAMIPISLRKKRDELPVQ
jgi:MFS family permease